MFIHALVTNNNLMKKMILLKNKLKMVFALQITSYTLKLLSSIFFIFHQKKTLEKFHCLATASWNVAHRFFSAYVSMRRAIITDYLLYFHLLYFM